MRARPLTDEEFPSENARNNRRRSEFACVGASGGGDDMYQTEYTRAFGINHDRVHAWIFRILTGYVRLHFRVQH